MGERDHYLEVKRLRGEHDLRVGRLQAENSALKRALSNVTTQLEECELQLRAYASLNVKEARAKESAVKKEKAKIKNAKPRIDSNVDGAWQPKKGERVSRTPKVIDLAKEKEREERKKNLDRDREELEKRKREVEVERKEYQEKMKEKRERDKEVA